MKKNHGRLSTWISSTTEFTVYNSFISFTLGFKGWQKQNAALQRTYKDRKKFILKYGIVVQI